MTEKDAKDPPAQELSKDKEFMRWWNTREMRARTSKDAAELTAALSDCVTALKPFIAEIDSISVKNTQNVNNNEINANAVENQPFWPPDQSMLLWWHKNLLVDLAHALTQRSDLNPEQKINAFPVIRSLLEYGIKAFRSGRISLALYAQLLSRCFAPRHDFYGKPHKDELGSDFRKKVLILYTPIENYKIMNSSANESSVWLIVLGQFLADLGGLDDLDKIAITNAESVELLFPERESDKYKEKESVATPNLSPEVAEKVPEGSKDGKEKESAAKTPKLDKKYKKDEKDKEKSAEKELEKELEKEKEKEKEAEKQREKDRERAQVDAVWAVRAVQRLYSYLSPNFKDDVANSRLLTLNPIWMRALKALLLAEKPPQGDIRTLTDELRTGAQELLMRSSGDAVRAGDELAAFDIRVAAQQLRGEQLQRRLRALQLLRAVIDRTKITANEGGQSSGAAKFITGLFTGGEKDAKDSQNSKDNKDKPLRARFEAVVDALKEEKVLERIAALLATHAEIFAQSAKVLQFSAEQHMLTTVHVDKLWSLRGKSHEHDVSVFDAAMLSLLPALDAPLLVHSLGHIDTALGANPANPAALLEHIARSCQALLALDVTKSDDKGIERALDVLWRHNNSHPSAASHLSRLLSHSRCAVFRDSYVNRCVKEIGSSNDVVSLLLLLWESYPSGKQRAQAVKDADKATKGLLDSILSPLKSSSAAADVMARLKLIAYAVFNAGGAITVGSQRAHALWICFSSQLSDSSLVGLWCSCLRDELGRAIDKEAAAVIFQKLSELPVSSMNGLLVELFGRYLIAVNVAEGKAIALGPGGCATDETLTGAESLWALALDTSDQKVQNIANQLLSELYTRLERGIRSDSKTQRVREAFVQRALSMAEQSPSRTSRVIALLQSYIDQEELPPSERQNMMEQNKQNHANNNASNADGGMSLAADGSKEAPKGKETGKDKELKDKLNERDKLAKDKDATIRVSIRYEDAATRSGVFRGASRVNSVLERAVIAFGLEGVPCRMFFQGKALLEHRSLAECQLPDGVLLTLKKVPPPTTQPLSLIMLSAVLPALSAALGLSASHSDAAESRLAEIRDAHDGDAKSPLNWIKYGSNRHIVTNGSSPVGSDDGKGNREDKPPSVASLAVGSQWSKLLTLQGDRSQLWSLLERLPIERVIIEQAMSSNPLSSFWQNQSGFALAYRLRVVNRVLLSLETVDSVLIVDLTALAQDLANKILTSEVGKPADNSGVDFEANARSLALALEALLPLVRSPVLRALWNDIKTESLAESLKNIAFSASNYAESDLSPSLAAAAERGMAVLCTLSVVNSAAANQLTKDPAELGKWLRAVLLGPSLSIRSAASAHLTSLVTAAASELAQAIWAQLVPLLSLAQNATDRAESFISLLERVLRSGGDSKMLDSRSLFSHLSQLIRPVSSSSSSTSPRLSKSLSINSQSKSAATRASEMATLALLATLLERDASLRSSSEARKLLRSVASDPERFPPNFSQRLLSSLALAATPARALRQLAVAQIGMLQVGSNYTVSVHNRVKAEMQSEKYTGLVNLGCTCYMNSTLQQLYLVPAFRASLLGSRDLSEFSEKESPLRQLQLLFARMQEGAEKYTDTRKFCRTLRIAGQKVNVSQQMDASEFLNALFEQLEVTLGPQVTKSVIRGLFGINLAHELRGAGDGCSHRKERLEPAFVIEVEVKNKKTLEEALALYVQGELLSGDNRYRCDHCNRPVDTLKRTVLADLPPLVFIHLKRFEVDYSTLMARKIMSYCEFPMRLDFKPFMREPHPDNPSPPSSPETEYALVGVTVHTGSLDSGHYYSFIRERDLESGESNEEVWFEFNDTSVSRYDPRRLPEDAFGGENVVQVREKDGKLQWETRPKPHSAYMLLYQRVGYRADLKKGNELTIDANVSSIEPKSTDSTPQIEVKSPPSELRKSQSQENLGVENNKLQANVVNDKKSGSKSLEGSQKGHRKSKSKKSRSNTDSEEDPKKEKSKEKSDDKEAQNTPNNSDKSKLNDKKEETKDNKENKKDEKKDKGSDADENSDKQSIDSLLNWTADGLIEQDSENNNDSSDKKDDRSHKKKGKKKDGEKSEQKDNLTADLVAQFTENQLASEAISEKELRCIAGAKGGASVPASVLRRILAENAQVSLSRQLFDSNYLRLLWHLVHVDSDADSGEVDPRYDPQLHKAQVAVIALTRLYYHSADKSALAMWTHGTKRLLAQSERACKWLLTWLLRDRLAFLRFTVNLPTGPLRASFAALIKQCVESLAIKERKLYDSTRKMLVKDGLDTITDFKNVSLAACTVFALMKLSFDKDTRDKMKYQSFIPVNAFLRLGNEERMHFRLCYGDGSLTDVFYKPLSKSAFFGQDKISGYYVISNKHITHRFSPLIEMVITFAMNEKPPIPAPVEEKKEADKDSVKTITDTDKGKEKEKEPEKEKEKTGTDEKKSKRGEREAEKERQKKLKQAELEKKRERTLKLSASVAPPTERSLVDEGFLFGELRAISRALRKEASIFAVSRLCLWECDAANHGPELAKGRTHLWFSIILDGLSDTVGVESVIPFCSLFVQLIQLRDSEKDWRWQQAVAFIKKALRVLQRSKSSADKFIRSLEAASRKNEELKVKLLKARKEFDEGLRVLDLTLLNGEKDS